MLMLDSCFVVWIGCDRSTAVVMIGPQLVALELCVNCEPCSYFIVSMTREKLSYQPTPARNTYGFGRYRLSADLCCYMPRPGEV